jgi:hypothetical protein
MWKLVKAELSYENSLIMTSSIIFMIIIILEKFIGGRFSIYYIGIFLVPYIILACIFINFGMLLREIQEKRLRCYATVPISIIEVGLGRTLIPVSVTIIYFVLIVLNDPNAFSELWDFWFHETSSGSGLYYWFNYIPYMGHTNSLTVMALLVIIPRIFTEKLGRLLLSAVALLLIIHGYILPFIDQSLALLIGDNIFYFFTGHFNEIYVMSAISLLSLLFIFLSTLMRKSYIES